MKPVSLLLIAFLISCKPAKEPDSVAASLDEYLSGQAKYFRINGNVRVTVLKSGSQAAGSLSTEAKA